MKLTRHRLDWFSLLAGLVTTTLAVVAFTDSWTRPVADWVWPTVLVAAGLLVLATVLLGRGEDAGAAGAAAATGPAPDPWDEDALADELRDDQSPDPAWASEQDPDTP